MLLLELCPPEPKAIHELNVRVGGGVVCLILGGVFWQSPLLADVSAEQFMSLTKIISSHVVERSCGSRLTAAWTVAIQISLHPAMAGGSQAVTHYSHGRPRPGLGKTLKILGTVPQKRLTSDTPPPRSCLRAPPQHLQGRRRPSKSSHGFAPAARACSPR